MNLGSYAFFSTETNDQTFDNDLAGSDSSTAFTGIALFSCIAVSALFA